MIARCEKEHRDGGVQTDMTEYRCVRLVGKRSQLKPYPPFDRKPMKFPKCVPQRITMATVLQSLQLNLERAANVYI